ncbi:MAG TPA: tetratricopeptide repeat protein, partial [Thermoanaerobaculia bacterium]
YQELARLASDKGKGSEAEKVLRRAVERFPEDLRLRIQLAAVLDHRGAAGEATAMIEKALESSGSGAKTGEVASSRYLYNAVRVDEFASTRTFLDESAKSRFQTLAQALSAPQADAQTSTGVAR